LRRTRFRPRGARRRLREGAVTVISSLKRATLALLATVALACGPALAQAPATNPPPRPNPIDANPVQAQQERQITQPLNNRPVWSEVRSGAPAYTSIRGRETNVLIQSEGQTWRALRVPIVFWGGVLFALTVLGTLLFYAWKGPMGSDYRPGGRLIERFSPADRYAHWLTAITFAILAVTGLILSLGKSVLLPLIGYTLFSWLATLAKNLHNFVGPILIVAAPWLMFRFFRDNLFNKEDVAFMKNIRGYFSGHEYPSGRFNAGEKFIPFWLMLVLATPVLVVTGLILVFPNFDQTRFTMQVTNIVHMVVAYGAIAMLVLHIYLGTFGFAGSYRGMRDGYVDENWAAHNHRYWYEDVVAGRARQRFVGDTDERHVDAVPQPRASAAD
jgi:formate dehydrogenase subunit gamma